MKTRLLVAVMILFVCVGFAFAGETARDGRFIAYDNGTVLDTKTNLMWAGQDNGKDIDWKTAKSYCENYRGAGYTDWRMPTKDELAGLSDKSIAYTGTKCGFDVHLTKLIRLTCGFVWSSETQQFESNRAPSAAGFSFSQNDSQWTMQGLGDSCRALPVRFGK
jgi:hypothetical protein